MNNASLQRPAVRPSAQDSLRMVAVVIFLILLVGALYTLLHEGGHALVGLLFGGKLRDFSINFFDLSAHVSIDGEFTRAQRAWISVAGVSQPLLVALAWLYRSPRGSNVILDWFQTLFFVSTISSLLAWVVIPPLVASGTPVSDDSANFLAHTGMQPWLLSAVALLVFLGGWLLLLKRVGGWSGLRGLVQYPSFSQSRRTLAGLILLMTIILVVGLGLPSLFPDTAFLAPEGYRQVAELDLTGRSYQDETVFAFDLEQPTQVGLYFLMEKIKGAPVRIALFGPDGYSEMFLSSDDPSLDIGRASVSPPPAELQPGAYQVRVTLQGGSGWVKVFTSLP